MSHNGDLAMNQVLCKGGMHYVPQIAIVERRNGRLICSVCAAMIKARMAGKMVARPVEKDSQSLPPVLGRVA